MAARWVFTRDQLNNSPSRKDGISLEKENETRAQICAFIQEAGQKLRLSQFVIATAIVFFHRFYACRSFKEHDAYTIGTTCLFLAGKVEESPRKLKDVVGETYKVKERAPAGPDPESRQFWDLKEGILVAERIVLQTLGFDLSIEHPYKILLGVVKKIQGNRDLAQVAWNFVNDSLRSTLCLQYEPRYIAITAIFLSSKFLKYELQRPVKEGERPPDGGDQSRAQSDKPWPWWQQFSVPMELING